MLSLLAWSSDALARKYCDPQGGSVSIGKFIRTLFHGKRYCRCIEEAKDGPNLAPFEVSRRPKDRSMAAM